MALFEKGNKVALGHGGRSHKYKEHIDAVFKDYNPLKRLKELSLTTDDEKIRSLCDKELAGYYAPKLKAVEHSGEISMTHLLHEDFVKNILQAEKSFDAENPLTIDYSQEEK